MSGENGVRPIPAHETPAIMPGPGFLDEEGFADQARRAVPSALKTGSDQSQGERKEPGAGLDEHPHSFQPLGPMVLEPGPEAPARVDVGWAPEEVAAPKVRVGTVGTGVWIAGGLGVLLVSWVTLSLASFVMGLITQSWVLGSLAFAAVMVGCALLARGAALELKAYRSMARVESLRVMLALDSTPLEVAREAALAWLRRVSPAVPESGAVERMLRAATTTTEIRALLRSQVADRLQETAARLGRQAAVDGATLVAVCPHAAWDGLLAGFRGLLVVRQVAALYGLRPSIVVTVALLRRVAWTAASTAGLSLLSQGMADQLGSVPVLKHVVAAVPGSGIAAFRLYRLAGIAAKACSPLE